MKSKLFRIMLPLLLVAVVGVGATTALLMSSTETLNNKFNPGEVTTTIEEEVSASDFSLDSEWTKVSKPVRIQNTNSTSTTEDDVTCFIRARITVSPEAILGLNGNDKQLTIGINNQDDIYSVTGATDTNWIYCPEDGFWYYLQPVEPNDNTEYLMQYVMVKNSITTNFDITIYQEAVNYQNFATLFEKSENIYNFVGGSCRGDRTIYTLADDATQEQKNALELTALQKAFELVTTSAGN